MEPRTNLEEPMFANTVTRDERGIWSGIIYATFRGVSLGHIEIVAKNQEAMKVLANGFYALVRALPPEIVRPS